MMASPFHVGVLVARTKLFSEVSVNTFCPCVVEDAAGRLVWDPSPHAHTHSEYARLVELSPDEKESLLAIITTLIGRLPTSIHLTHSPCYPHGSFKRMEWLWCPLPSTALPPMEQIRRSLIALNHARLSDGEENLIKGQLLRAGICEIPKGDRLLPAFHELAENVQPAHFSSLSIIKPGWIIRGSVYSKAVLGPARP